MLYFTLAVAAVTAILMVRRRTVEIDPEAALKEVFQAHFNNPLTAGGTDGPLRGRVGRWTVTVDPRVEGGSCWHVSAQSRPMVTSIDGILPGTRAALDKRCATVEPGMDLENFLRRGALHKKIYKAQGASEVLEVINEARSVAEFALEASMMTPLDQLRRSVSEGDVKRAVDDFQELWARGSEVGVPAWRSMRNSDVPALWVEAAIAVGPEQAAALLAEEDLRAGEQLRLIDYLAEQPAPHVQLLANALSTESPDPVRIRVLKVAAKLPDERFVPGLIETCSDPQGFVTNQAFKTLAAFPEPTINRVLAVALTKLQDPLLLQLALDLAALHGDRSLLPALVAIRDAPVFSRQLRALAESVADTVVAGSALEGGSLTVFEEPIEGGLSAVEDDEIGQLSPAE